MLSRSEYSILFAIFTAILIVACGGGGGGSAPAVSPGINSVVTAQSPVPPGPWCEFGGIQVDSGIDVNYNGQLDPTEVDDSQIICNGVDGLTSLVSISNVASGPECTYGGKLIETGLDTNRNGILNSSETIDTQYVCNLAQDSSPPTMPTGLTADSSSVNEISLSWSVSTDNFSVVGYNIYRDGSLLTTSATNSFTDSNLIIAKEYCYSVSAIDLFNNESSITSEVCYVPYKIRLSDTGQSTSYTSTWGEDSNYLLSAPSFTNNLDGTITDNNTYLMWQTGTAVQDTVWSLTWDKAYEYCDTLGLASHYDWRLPTIQELLLASFNADFHVQDSSFWSSTVSDYLESEAWSLDYANSAALKVHTSLPSKYTALDARCVRGGELHLNEFVDNGDGTVSNPPAGLIWEQGSGGPYTWENALNYCEALSAGGHTDWRLPGFTELATLFDFETRSPALDIFVFNTISSPIITSTSVDASFAYSADIEGVFNTGDDKTNNIFHAKCVRGGGALSIGAFVNGQSASVVIGQADFYNGSANQGGSASEYTIAGPWGNPAVIGNMLFLPEYDNSRVLVYNSIPAVNNAPADFVLGQPDFATTSVANTQAGMRWPVNVASDNGKLFVADYGNHRILVYNTIPTSTGDLPDVVVGQPDFTSSDPQCDESSLSYPEGLYAVDGKLIVADLSNDRVLIWNSVPGINNSPADIVLGQANFTSCNDNPGGQSAYTLSGPNGIWSDGEKLIVLDSNNNRALIWNTFPIVSNTPADVVVGQADFASQDWTVSQTGLGWALDLHSNGTQLFVADYDGNRIMVWDQIPSINNAPADAVLGQPDFTSSTWGTAPDMMGGPAGVFAYGNQLIVGEYDNHRLLIFNSQ